MLAWDNRDGGAVPVRNRMSRFTFAALALSWAWAPANTAASVGSDPDCVSFAQGKPEFEDACLDNFVDQPQVQAFWQGMAHIAQGSDMLDVDMALEKFRFAAEPETLPQADFMLGVVLSSGELLPRDYTAARAHLERALAAGHVQSMSYLAKMRLEGLAGFTADTDAALALFSLAGSYGDSHALQLLGDLYLAGVRLPRDIEKAKEYFGLAAAKGRQYAQSRLRMIELADKMTNVQTIPGAPGEPHQVVQYNGIDAPPLPRSAGFDEEFEALYNRPAGDSAAIVEDLRARRGELAPPYLFESARRLAMLDDIEAWTVLAEATAQGYYDGQRCKDRSAAQATMMWQQVIMSSFPKWMAMDTQTKAAKTAAGLRNAPINENGDASWICFSGMQAISAAIDGEVYDDWLKPEESWPEIKANVTIKLEEVAVGVEEHAARSD